ncbi:hypothetical protein [Vibrio sinaloensis]|uniref:hypothetical protein n=1 Tax=Photobacterium sp. (strain ATCC 43367) TaxID=379097 RepID=UPI000692297A|nr:hypothetical protein [Vibrio sinaloensis]
MLFYRQIETVSNRTHQAAKFRRYAGYDPFDGLNSRLFDVFPFLKNTTFGLAWIQLFKRSHINFRPVLGVPQKRNPKGIGLFILGMIEDYQRTSEVSFLLEAVDLGNWLLTQQCDKSEWQHACWGYHFDWKARAFYVPKGKPNVITTIYVAQALYKLSKEIQSSQPEQAKRFLDQALDAANFIVKTLYTEADDRAFFAYIPGETTFVHNASLWAAAWVAVVSQETCNQEYRDLAIRVAKQSVSEQSDDGSWVYGSRHHHQFIDGFHTGYNLEALHIIRQALSTDEFDQSIDKGLQYYRENLIDSDGTAKYYNNNPYPLDPHSVSQAIITLLKLGDGSSDLNLVKKVIERAFDTLYLPDEAQFVYQKSKSHTNKINYMRWTQAWMYYALSYYLNATSEEHGTN